MFLAAQFICAANIRSRIEVVITGLTRNQFARKRTRVRIPSSPPNNQPDSGFPGSADSYHVTGGRAS